MNLRDQYKAVLESKGYKQDKSYRTSRYIVMTKEGETKKFFLGESGALRIGATVATSFGCTENFRKSLQEQFRKLAANPTIETLGL